MSQISVNKAEKYHFCYSLSRCFLNVPGIAPARRLVRPGGCGGFCFPLSELGSSHRFERREEEGEGGGAAAAVVVVVVAAAAAAAAQAGEEQSAERYLSTQPIWKINLMFKI